jgi:aliphatic nitrilase
MSQTYPAYRVAAMHISPVFLDTAATIDKAASLLVEAARNGAKLIAFPEAFVPAFPLWSSIRAPIRNHKFFRALAREAVRVPGPELAQLARIARDHSVVVSMGINEGTAASVGCIWNANVIIGTDGRLLNHHRKVVPTFFEKMAWANGDGAGLRVVDTPLGRLGMLICGENGNPLARFTLMAQGEQVHIANYPSLWPNGGDYSLADAIRVRAAAHCLEAKVFTIVSSSFLTDDVKDLMTEGDRAIRETLDGCPRTESMIIGPNGETKGGPARDQEEIVYADIDLADCVVPKQFHDVVGYYNRFDIFNLSVNRSPNDPVHFDPDAQGRMTVGIDLADNEELLSLQSCRLA